MDTVRAAVMVGPNRPIEIREFPEPDLEPGGALLRTTYSEVCGTDVHLWRGHLAEAPFPIIPGHINVGVLEDVHGEVLDVEEKPFREGDLVTFLDVHETCGRCWYCLVAKATTRCPHRKVYGITYSADDGLLGGWSEKVYLKPGVKLLRLPTGVGAEAFIAGGCALPTALHAVERAGIVPGDTVAVQGSGPVGLWTTALAARGGAARVIVVGAPALRLATAREFGASETIDIYTCTSEERIEAVRERTGGRGADVTIEATGVAGAVVEGLRMTRDAGRYVVVGQYSDTGDVTLNPHHDLNRKHIEVRAVWGIDYSHLYRGVQLLARYAAELPLERMVTRRYGLEEAEQALRDVEGLQVVKAVLEPNAA